MALMGEDQVNKAQPNPEAAVALQTLENRKRMRMLPEVPAERLARQIMKVNRQQPRPLSQRRNPSRRP